MNGVIWSRTQQNFVPISSVPIYAMLQQERLRQSRELEVHNFQLQNLTLTSFQEPTFFQFYDNDTKVTGFCGEIWNLLSESLNFTLQPVKANVDSLGMIDRVRSVYETGLLGMISRNETIAIPKVEIFVMRLLATDFTLPFVRDSQLHLYISPKMEHDNMWMVKVFSWKIWCIILIMCVLLSLCTFVIQNVQTRNKDKKRENVSFIEHLFYSFGNLCSQGYIPQNLYGKSRILEVSLGLFCSVICMSFGAVLFTYIMKNVFVPPFNNLKSLLTDTTYNIVGLKNTDGAIFILNHNNEIIVHARQMNRTTITFTLENMHKIACLSQKKRYAILQNEIMHKVNGDMICHLIKMAAIAEAGTSGGIASGIVRNYKYKRTINLGILKLMEVGLLNVLKERWLENRFKHIDAPDNTPVPIDIQQVSLIIIVMCGGMIMALIIFIIEKIIFAYKSKRL